jgi:hypothetical protein
MSQVFVTPEAVLSSSKKKEFILQQDMGPESTYYQYTTVGLTLLQVLLL